MPLSECGGYPPYPPVAAVILSGHWWAFTVGQKLASPVVKKNFIFFFFLFNKSQEIQKNHRQDKAAHQRKEMKKKK